MLAPGCASADADACIGVWQFGEPAGRHDHRDGLSTSQERFDLRFACARAWFAATIFAGCLGLGDALPLSLEHERSLELSDCAT
jgi:hypothetical protein